MVEASRTGPPTANLNSNLRSHLLTTTCEFAPLGRSVGTATLTLGKATLGLSMPEIVSGSAHGAGNF